MLLCFKKNFVIKKKISKNFKKFQNFIEKFESFSKQNS